MIAAPAPPGGLGSRAGRPRGLPADARLRVAHHARSWTRHPPGRL